MKKNQLILIGVIIILIVALIVLFLRRQQIINETPLTPVIEENLTGVTEEQNFIEVIGEQDGIEDINREITVIEENLGTVDEMILNLEQELQNL